MTTSARQGLHALALAGVVLLAGGCNDLPGFNDQPTGIPVKLAFTVQPSEVNAGSLISPAVSVALKDEHGFTVAESTATISVDLELNPGGAVLGGSLDRVTDHGVAEFNNLTLDQPGSGYTLRATAPGLADGVSIAFEVVQAPPPPISIVVNVGPNTAYVSARNFTQNPAVDTVAIGGKVTWVWKGTLPHRIRSYLPPTFPESDTLTAPASYEHVFSVGGTYLYDCYVHGNKMSGILVVR